MKKLALMLAQCLLLAGCTGLPQPREMGEMALIRTVGVDGKGEQISLTASTGRRASGTQGEQEGALVLSGEGTSLSAAALELRRSSGSCVFFGYTDKLLLGQESGDFRRVLGWLANDSELGLGAAVWLLGDSSARAAVEAGGEEGVEATLTALEREDRLGTGAMKRTAGEVYISLLERGCAAVPVLSARGELSPAGYAVLTPERVALRLEGESAWGLELLCEHPPAAVIEVALPGNRVCLTLTSAQLDCRPVFTGDRLERLELTCRAEGRLEQWDRPPDAGELARVRGEAEKRLRDQLALALEEMGRHRCECAGIGSRVAIAAPGRWERLEDNWQQAFAAAVWETAVELSLG